MSIRTRLTLNYLLVLLISMGLAAFLTWRVVESLYITTQRENLLAQAKITAASLQDSPLPAQVTERYSQTSNVLPGLHTRVLDEQGGVVIGLPLTANSSSYQVPLAENSGYVPADQLLTRPEIQAAYQGTPATAVRRVASAGNRRVMYAAAPIYAANEISGITYLASPLPPAGLPISAVMQFLGVFGAAVLFAIITGAWLARRIARPLEGLAIVAEAVSDGDLEAQVPTRSGVRELDSLGTSFNAMTASLRQSDQAKNAFIADVTHELRTPLTVIKGTIETLEDGAIDDIDGRGPLLATMQRETDRLIRLVLDLLVLTRVDAGMLKLNLDQVDIAKLARERCQTLLTVSEPEGIEIQVNADGPCYILGDPDRLSQIFDNLLDNAIRYAKSRLTVTVRPDRDELLCAVHDDGPGIPVDHLPHIFERFYRVDASRSRHTGGAGLGLAIVKALVIAHYGHIQADSIEGKGTTITFWLPEMETVT